MLRWKKTGSRLSPKPSLTSLLSGLVIVVVFLTSTILLMGTYDSKKKSLIETTLRLNLSSAERMSKTMDSLFRSITGSLRYNAASFADVNNMKPEEINIDLGHMYNSSNFFNSLILIGANGVILNAYPPGVTKTGERASSAAVQEALSLQKPSISAPYTTPNSKRLIVLVNQPIWGRDGSYVGMLSGSMYLQEKNVISEVFGNNTVDDYGSYYYVVDASGHVLYHPDKARIGVDLSANKVVQRLETEKSGMLQAYNLYGVEMLAGYSAIPANGWGVVMVSPVEGIRHQLLGHFRTLIAYSLLPFLLLLAGVVLIARQLAQPFTQLADLVSKMGREPVKLPEVKHHLSREADLLAKAVFLAARNIQKQKEQLTQEAATDALTGLLNRRALEYTMGEWMEAQLPFSLIILDVDNFKLVNDTYGHGTGDEVLKHVAHVFSSSLRPGDICYRYGGEEFVILLAGTEAGDAYTIAERVRRALEGSRAPIPGKVTVSAGIAHYPRNASDWDTLLSIADDALYQAKNSGRNRSMMANGVGAIRSVR